MNIMLLLLSLISFLLTFVSGSPVVTPRQDEPATTPTACLIYSTMRTWMPAATNPAAIPKGLLTPCQRSCLAYDYLWCAQAAMYWNFCFHQQIHQQNTSSIRKCLCQPPIYYGTAIGNCADCLATAQYFANKDTPPAQPAPDFFDLNTGLKAQLSVGYRNYCGTNIDSNTGTLLPSTGDDTIQSLERYLCLTREITEHFGGPIAMMNFTLKDYPSLAWDGVSPVPGGNPFGPLPTPTP